MRSIGILIIVLALIGVVTLAVMPDPCSQASYDRQGCLMQRSWNGDHAAQAELNGSK